MRNRRQLFLAIILFANAARAAAGEKLPAALFGDPLDVKSIETEALKPNGIAAAAPAEWLKPDDYGKYSVVYIGATGGGTPEGLGWPDDAAKRAVIRYVEGGGVVILGGDAVLNAAGKMRDVSPLADLLGFSHVQNLEPPNRGGFKFSDKTVPDGAGIADSAYEWFAASSQTAGKIGSAKILAMFEGENPVPAMTVNRIGKGAVYWLSPALFRLRQKRAETGVADENGVFTPDSAGKSVIALTQLYAWLFRQSGSVATAEAGKESGWGADPLGEPGNLKYVYEFPKQPQFKEREPAVRHMPLAENGRAAAEIVVPPGSPREQKKLAVEIKYHLDAITGGDFPITEKRSPGKNAVIVADAEIAKSLGFDYAGMPPDTAIAVTEGDAVVLAGPGEGVSLSVYYFLEKLGCRYLWPGRLGKVIPKDESLWAPSMRLIRAPMAAIRHIRNRVALTDRDLTGMRNLGMGDLVDGYNERYQSAFFDHPGNAGFYRWHGQRGKGKEREWGHHFGGGFYERFSKSHPEFFALQPDGTRDQGQSPNRPRLCHSNPDLAAAVAAERIAHFKKNPKLEAASVALADGGFTGFCLCENCRKADPANAPPATMLFPRYPGLPAVEYVSLTDRVLAFSNRIAEAVVKEMPDRKLTMYAYSVYRLPPVKVKPHPALAILHVSMDYKKDSRREEARRTLAAWANFKNELFWRPNALFGFRDCYAPQNYARRMFDDTEILKANNMKGADFDCNEQHWAAKGLVYYMLSKALWNPDRLNYDAILEDYCRSGFGAAASSMMEYFAILEKTFDAAAANEMDYLDVFTEEVVDSLRARLAEAKRKAEGDETILERLRFLELGVRGGELNRRLRAAKAAGDRQAFASGREDFLSLVRNASNDDPLAVRPGVLGFYFQFRSFDP